MEEEEEEVFAFFDASSSPEDADDEEDALEVDVLAAAFAAGSAWNNLPAGEQNV